MPGYFFYIILPERDNVSKRVTPHIMYYNTDKEMGSLFGAIIPKYKALVDIVNNNTTTNTRNYIEANDKLWNIYTQFMHEYKLVGNIDKVDEKMIEHWQKINGTQLAADIKDTRNYILQAIEGLQTQSEVQMWEALDGVSRFSDWLSEPWSVVLLAIFLPIVSLLGVKIWTVGMAKVKESDNIAMFVAAGGMALILLLAGMVW